MIRDRETIVELGLGLFAALLLGALGILLASRSAGGAHRRRQRAATPPPLGAIPAERQRARVAVSPR